METMMILGQYAFGLNTAAFQELNRSTEWRWPSQDVFDALPALQFTGYGPDTITLPGIIFPEYWGGTGQVDQLRALGDQARPHTLIDGRGNVLGEFVVTGVQERQSVFGAAGVARRQEFTVTLQRYNSATTTGATGTGRAPLAVITGSTSVASLVDNADARAAREVGAMESAAASVNALVGTTVRPILGALNAVGQGLGAARSVQSATRDARAAIQAAGEINSLSSAQSALGGLLRSTSNATQTAVSASGTLSQTITDLTAAGESTGVLGVLRGARDATNRTAITATGIRANTEDVIRGFES